MAREVPLTQGKVAIVDDEDFERVSAFTWHANRARRKHLSDVFYASRVINLRWVRGRAGTTKELLHHFILGSHSQVDHIDHDGLNNQKANLRLADRSQNAANSRHWNPSKHSRFRGVTWSKAAKRWQAQIQVKGVSTYLGLFDSEEAAALAYDSVALKAFGEFASTNFPEVTS